MTPGIEGCFASQLLFCAEKDGKDTTRLLLHHIKELLPSTRVAEALKSSIIHFLDIEDDSLFTSEIMLKDN